MLSVTELSRKFKFKKNKETINLQDPNPEMSPEEVMRFYSGQHPELTTSTISGPKIEDDSAVYEFETTIGNKG